MAKNHIYHAGSYVRLSKEDGQVAANERAESNSISNQKDLIREFLRNREDIVIEKEYVDDGYSGTDFLRPSFQMMLDDIRAGKIDCVITKDLSRFGREYIDSGMYIERLFPALGVRFIAINDNIDTMQGNQGADEIIIPFKNLINDAYSRDISIKIRSHLDIKRRKGEVVTSFVPYGYVRDEENKHQIVPDPYAGEIVKDIFRMKIHGMSQDAIARYLNQHGVLSPMEYKNSIGIHYKTPFKMKEMSEWGSVTVRRILENEVYVGNLIQGKTTTPNYKVKRAIQRSESEWVRVDKNHQAIVSDRDFEIVQRLLLMDTRTAPDNDGVYILSGIAVCADCGATMVRKVSTVKGKKYAYYMCSNHKQNKQCTSHRISESVLEDAVLELIKQQIKSFLDLEKILSFIGEVPFQKLDIQRLEEQQTKKEHEIEKCIQLKTMLYEDYKEGVLSKTEYLELHGAYEERKKRAEAALHQLKLEVEKILSKTDDKSVWINYFVKYQDIEHLSRNVVVELIKEIKVFDKNHIEVEFEFDDCYQQTMQQITQIEKQELRKGVM